MRNRILFLLALLCSCTLARAALYPATSWSSTNILDETSGATILANLTAPRYVNTFASLAACGTDGPGTVETLGHTTAGDGGGAQYIQVASSTYATNELVLNGVGCQWVEKDWLESRTFNLKRMGAIADGVTDCTTSISNALRLVNIYGGTAYFPKGKYRQASSLNFMTMTNQNGFVIKGDGPENTWIYGDFPGLETISGEYSRLWRWKDGAATGSVTGPTIEGLRFSGPTNGSTNAPHRLLSFNRAGTQVGLTIRNCTFSHSGNGALELGGSDLRDSVIEHVVVRDDMTNTNIAVEGAGSIGWAGTGLTIRDVVTTNVGCDPAGAPGLHGMYLTGTGVQLDGWRAYGKFSGGPGRISNSRVSGVEMYDCPDGFLLSVPSTNVIVTGLVIQGQAPAIKLYGSDGVVMSGVSVRGTNVFDGYVTNANLVSISASQSRNVRFTGWDVKMDGGVFMTLEGSTNIVVENSRIVLPYSTELVTVGNNDTLTLRNNRVEILGGSSHSFVLASNTTNNADNVLSTGNRYIWNDTHIVYPWEVRNTSVTNWVSIGDTWEAPASTGITWEGRSASYYTGFKYYNRTWTDLSGKYTDQTGVSQQVVARPPGFVYPTTAPAFDVLYYPGTGKFGVSISPKDFDTPRALTLYVSPFGNDSNDGLSPVTAKLTIGSAVSAVGTNASYEICLAPGVYAGSTANITKPVTYRCRGGRAIINAGGLGGRSAIIHTGDTNMNTWVWLAHVPTGVIDCGTPTSLGIPRLLASAASLNDCIATPGTWYTDSTDTYVHLADNRRPDDNVSTTVTVATDGVFRASVGGYCENVTLFAIGHPLKIAQSAAGPTGYRWVFNNVDFMGGGALDTFEFIANSGWVGLWNCRAAYSTTKDGLNYHKYNTYLDLAILEVDCEGHMNGTGTTANNNGSTVHDGIAIVRVNGRYLDNGQRNIHDINDGHTWCLGTVVGHTIDGTTSDGFASGVGTDSHKMWLDRCWVIRKSQVSDLHVYTGASVFYRNMDITGWNNVNGGTLTTY